MRRKKFVIPDYATWQLVSNINDKSKVTVQFFSPDGILMYEETLHNVKLDITKKRTVHRLNEVLKQVHEAWVKDKVRMSEKEFVARKLNP